MDDMRMILRNNTKVYLQQELTGYAFDCFIIPPKASAKPAEKTKGTMVS